MSKENKKLTEIPMEEDSYGYVFTLDEKDHLYILEQKEKEEGNQLKVYQKIYQYDLDGNKLGEIELGSHIIEEDDYLGQLDFELDRDGNFYFLYRLKKLWVTDRMERCFLNLT